MPISAEAQRHLAVIPARGGSKRLPRKNIIDFLGKPIIAYTIKAANEARVFDRILVSTDDDQIAFVARRYQAAVDRRPPELGTDAATVIDVCVELLERLAAGGERFDTLTVLYSTAPLRNALDIRKTHGLLEAERCDYSLATSAFQQPVHQALVLKGESEVEPIFADLVNKRASDAGRYVAGNGSTYCVRVPLFLRTRTFSGANMRAHLMPPERSVDIDTANDLELARFYGKRLLKADTKSRARKRAVGSQNKSRRRR